jgi:hypothetical protein
VGSLVFALARGERDRQVQHGSRTRWTVVAVAAAIALLTTSASAWTLSQPRYRLREGNARAALIAAYLKAGSCNLCWSSRRGRIDVGQLARNDVRELTIRPGAPRAGRVRFELTATGSEGPAFGTARFDFGDGAVSDAQSFSGRVTVQHAYSNPGEYRVRAWFDGPGVQRLVASETIHVEPDPVR